ncbi:hypothetical protein LZ31DRAFT_618673, partial [Colletotrichum somersetense]
VNPGIQAVILALCSRNIGKTANKTTDIVSIPKRIVNNILACVKKLGFDPTAPTLTLLPEYYHDAPRAGRPKKATQSVADLIV